MEFDFSKLNGREFETLGASVIEKLLNVRVEKFKSGRDGGVDGRFWIGEKNEGIIQCKHYIETPYKTLVSKLKTEELPKVEKLKPKKYIFITSKKLSRINKQEIKRIFEPFIVREDDIIGMEDLNDFLSKRENQNVVEQNLKLWISSTSVLDIIYNNAIKGRSESSISEIHEKAYKYVITNNHKIGLEKLNKRNVVILIGEPGIGKTTLADNLALYYTAEGYEFCDIEENISEAENIFREKEKNKILFYCDDFLGSNLYDAINNKRDSHIVKFIKRVHNDNSKKFILTSRTNILNKAYSQSHKFQNEKISDNEFLLKVDNLTDLEKAKILYNHIYHSNLNKEYIDQIYEDKRYREIIKHKNFNPRIIEFIMDKIRVGDVTPDNYWKFIKKNLEEPEEIWSDYFQNQTDDCVRALTFLTVYNNGKISEGNLRRSYNSFLKIHNVNLGDHSDKSFESVRKLATGSLLNRNQVDDNEYEYILFNPSITDFVLSSYSKETELISNIIISLESETSLIFLKSLSNNFKINSNSLKKIQENLFDFFYENKLKEENWDFLVLLSCLDITNKNLLEKIDRFIRALINNDDPYGNKLSELLYILTEFKPEFEFENFKFLYNFIIDLLDEDELIDLLNFIDRFSIVDSYIISQVTSQIESYLGDVLDMNELDIDFSRHISQYHDYDGNLDYDIDISSIESDVYDILNSYLDNFNQISLEKIDLNTSRIVSYLDLEGKAKAYMDKQEFDEDDRIGGNYTDYSSNDDIDDIFERTS